MSKTKENLLYQEEERMKYQMKFMEWIYDTFQPQLLSMNDVDDMEKSYGNSSSRNLNKLDEIIPSSSLNNYNYSNKKEQVS